MYTKVNESTFAGQPIYVGIDVHLKSWKVTVMAGDIHYKTFSAPPEADKLTNYLKQNFPGANYFSAYEAGFCGFSVHRELIKEMPLHERIREDLEKETTLEQQFKHNQGRNLQSTGSDDERRRRSALSKFNGMHVHFQLFRHECNAISFLKNFLCRLEVLYRKLKPKESVYFAFIPDKHIETAFKLPNQF
jgi:hypothetical protein